MTKPGDTAAFPPPGSPGSGEPPDCEQCGACCAVSWTWPVLIGPGDGAGIPRHFLAGNRMRCDGDRCTALAGQIGDQVHCRVYDDRPLVCREFEAGGDACRAVRRRFGFD